MSRVDAVKSVLALARGAPAPLPGDDLRLVCHCGDTFPGDDQKGLARHVWSAHKGYPTRDEQKPRRVA